MIVILYLMQLK